MERNNRNSERDKMLEDILSTVGKPTKSSSSNNRAARAAASSANREASEKRAGKSEAKTSQQSSASAPKRNESVYSRATGVRKNTSAKKLESYTKNTENDNSEKTGMYSRKSLTQEKTELMEKVNEEETVKTAVDENDGETEVKIRKVNTDTPDNKNRGKRSRKKRSRPSGRLPLVLIVTTIIFTIAISLSVVIISVGRDMLAIGKSDEVKIITIPEGSTTVDIAEILNKEGIIEIPKAFIYFSKLNGADTKYIPGEHEVSPSYAYETIINELTTDKSLETETVDVIFYEGCDLISAAQKLEDAGVCEAERFIYYFNAGGYGFEFEDYLPASNLSKFHRMEGYLFPDTYTFYVDTDPEIVCQKIYKNFNDKFTEEYYAQMRKLDMTLDEVITLASIVQAESPDVKTMKNVASVFENRLADPETFPKLQSDPTSKYVREVIKPNIDVPSEAIFEAYDTYESNGLPPGAIGNPGLDAIEAVLYPADTEYYFFYANIDTRETFYAKTNEEHEENIAMVKEQQAADDEEENGEE